VFDAERKLSGVGGSLKVVHCGPVDLVEVAVEHQRQLSFGSSCNVTVPAPPHFFDRLVMGKGGFKCAIVAEIVSCTARFGTVIMQDICEL